MANTQQRRHAGEGRGAENAITFIIIFAMFLTAIWVLSFADFTVIWPFAVCLGLAFLAFWIPQTILGRSDTGGAEDPDVQKGALAADAARPEGIPASH